MCIYFKDKGNLTYNGREHIFPASIGGKARLKKGIVSDQANDYFSPLEGLLFHESIVAIPKMLFGPGRRGTKKEGKVVVNVIKDDNNHWGLGYIFLGKSYVIPHLRFDEYNCRAVFPSVNDDGTNPTTGIKHLIEKLLNMPEDFTYFHKPDLGKTVMIGFYKKKYYIASSLIFINTELLKNLIGSIDINNEETKMKLTESTQTHSIELKECEDNARVYGKIAFNVLAHLKGAEFVLQTEFDGFRDWLIGKATRESRFCDIIDIPKEYDLFIPKDSHFCIITYLNGEMLAQIGLYYPTRLVWKFSLGFIKTDGDHYPIGLICSNVKEQTLLEMICDKAGIEEGKS